MDFTELVHDRRSIRRFSRDQIDNKAILDVIALATQACNAGGEQKWHFKVIKNDELKSLLAQLVRDRIKTIARSAGVKDDALKPVVAAADFFADAPAVIAVITERYRSKTDRMLQTIGYSDREIDELRCRPDLQTVGAVVQLMLLAAWEKGLGGCWMTGPMAARPELEKALGIFAPASLAALVPLGRPAITPQKGSRKPVEDVVSFIE